MPSLERNPGSTYPQNPVVPNRTPMEHKPNLGYASPMVRYRRNFIPGGTFFFTVTLRDRHSRVLIEHITLLRASFRVTRSERPFTIDAIVVLPDHLHVIMTLPADDCDSSFHLYVRRGWLPVDLGGDADAGMTAFGERTG